MTITKTSAKGAAFVDWTKVQGAEWNLGMLFENTKFARFMDPDTDNAWLGFSAGWDCRESTITALTDEVARLREVLIASDQFIMEHTPDYLFVGAGEELIGLIRAALEVPK